MKKHFNREKKYIDSYVFVKFLVECKDKLLTQIELTDEIHQTLIYKKLDDIKTLEYTDQQAIPNVFTEKDADEYTNYFNDFEIITEREKHIAYSIRVAGYSVEFLGEKL